MGRVGWSSEVFNCSAPDTGNMEVFRTYGTEAQKQTWLKPLMAGEIRSAFLMTEPGVASSDATNIETSIVRQGDEYVINGRKWWSSGVGDPRCKIAIVMGKTDPSAPRHAQQSQVLVPLDSPGIVKVRALQGVRLRRCAAWPLRGGARQRPRAGFEHDPWAKAGALRSRRAASGRGASIIACAASAPPNARLKRCASG